MPAHLTSPPIGGEEHEGVDVTLRRDERVPLLHHVAVLIHHRVPAGDGGSFYDRMGAVSCWNAVMDEDRYMVQKWNQFIAA